MVDVFLVSKDFIGIYMYTIHGCYVMSLVSRCNPRLFEGNGCLNKRRNGRNLAFFEGILRISHRGSMFGMFTLTFTIKYRYPRQNVDPLLKVDLFVDYIKNTHKGAVRV